MSRAGSVGTNRVSRMEAGPEKFTQTILEFAFSNRC